MSRPHSYVLSARTDRGAVRPRNEDAVLADVVPAGRDLAILLAVADGVGGHGHGDWASRRALELFSERVAAALGAGVDPGSALVAAFEQTNETLYHEAAEQHPGARPATTLAAAIVLDDTLWWANVGDSRIYLVGRSSAEQLSRDHSLVAEQVEAGVLSAEEAADAPFGNVITRSVGFEPTVLVDQGGPIALAPGDAIAVCSDGLYRVVPTEELASVVALYAADAAARELIALANRRGAPDNVSVAIYRVPNPGESAHQTVRLPMDADSGTSRRWKWWPLAAAVLLVAAAAATLATISFGGIRP